MSNPTLEGMARKDHLMHRMFVEYNRHLANCMHDKKSVGDRDREDAMAKAVQFLADNVSDEMVQEANERFNRTLWADTEAGRKSLFKLLVETALRAAAGGGEK